MRPRYGMTIPLPGIPLAEHQPWLREIVDLGYTDLWTMETDGLDAFTPLDANRALEQARRGQEPKSKRIDRGDDEGVLGLVRLRGLRSG